MYDLKVIKTVTQRIFLDMIIFNEASLYVNSYFTFFKNFLEVKSLNSPHGNSASFLESRSSPSLS